MLESILFKNTQIVTPDGIRKGDVLVKNGKIVEVSPSISASAELEISEAGLTLLPGCIDPHVHFRDPGAEWKEDLASGSRAAVAGGVTSFFDMPNTKPSATTRELIAQKKQIASEKSVANYNFFIGATPDNLDELNTVENVPGIKIYVGSSTGSLLVDQINALEPIFQNGNRLIAVHSEDEATIQENIAKYAGSTDVADHERIRSPEAAITCTKMLVELALKHKRRLHICHLTTQEEAEFLAALPPNPYVTTEVCTQHLLLHGRGLYDRLGTFAQINPPVREDSRHAQALWKALKSGVIRAVVTDHAPHTVEEKQKPFGEAPSGMPGVETSLSLMLTLVAQGKCSLEDVVRWMSAEPASLFNIENKGAIEPGMDADLVLVDLNAKRTISNGSLVTKCNWSAFDGWEVTGVPVATFVNGQMVFREGDFIDSIKGQEVIIS